MAGLGLVRTSRFDALALLDSGLAWCVPRGSGSLNGGLRLPMPRCLPAWIARPPGTGNGVPLQQWLARV